MTLFSRSMQRPIRIVFLLFLVLATSGVTAPGQQASGSPAKPSAVLTPIPLIKVPLEAQSAVASLQEIEADVSRDQSSADEDGRTLLELTNEIDSRIDDDTKVLNSSPSLDVLYRLKLSWRNFGLRLSVLEAELTRYASSMEEQLARVDQLNRNWQATLQSAKQPQIPPTVLQSVQNVVDSIERTRQVSEFGQDHILTLQSKLSTEQARVRRALSSIGQAENRALQNIFVRNSQPVWSLETSLGTEWLKHSDESFSSQLRTSIVFSKRLPFTFLFHALFVVLVATALHWMRRRIQRLAKQKPDLQHALPILDLPVSTALALSMLLVLVIYAQAPRLILAIMGALTLIPAAMILRRLLDRHSYPILNAIVIMYFVANSAFLWRLSRCWPGSYFSASCWAPPFSWSGCFGAGAHRRKPLKPMAAFGESSERLPKSGLSSCRQRSWPMFSGMSTWEIFWASFFSGALTSRPCSILLFGSSKDCSLLPCKSGHLVRYGSLACIGR